MKRDFPKPYNLFDGTTDHASAVRDRLCRSIHDSLNSLNTKVNSLTDQHGDISRTLPQSISTAIKDETASLQNRWLLTTGSMILGLIGLTLTMTSNAKAFEFLKQNGAWVGLTLVAAAMMVMIITSRRRPATNEPKR